MTTAEKGVRKVKRRTSDSEIRLKRLENRITNLEKEVKALKTRLKKKN